MTDSYNQAQLLTELKQDEGFRNQAYVDTVGLVTIGIGRELSRKGLSDSEVLILWQNDVASCCAIMDQEIPWWRNLADNEQRCMINLCFMGWGSFSGFKNFLHYMELVAVARTSPTQSGLAGTLQLAAQELQNSEWWEQVKSRGPRVVARLLNEPRLA